MSTGFAPPSNVPPEENWLPPAAEMSELPPVNIGDSKFSKNRDQLLKESQLSQQAFSYADSILYALACADASGREIARSMMYDGKDDDEDYEYEGAAFVGRVLSLCGLMQVAMHPVQQVAEPECATLKSGAHVKPNAKVEKTKAKRNNKELATAPKPASKQEVLDANQNTRDDGNNEPAICAPPPPQRAEDIF